MTRHPWIALAALVALLFGLWSCGTRPASTREQAVSATAVPAVDPRRPIAKASEQPGPSQPTANGPAPVAAVRHRVVARFVGELGEVGLPQARTKVIPIGYDPNFVVPIRVSRVVEGRLSLEGGTITFLIHSPALFFGANLGAPPEGNHPEGQFLFTLVADEAPEGTAYDLSMSRLEPAAGSGPR
jgi:hypothetical protein